MKSGDAPMKPILYFCFVLAMLWPQTGKPQALSTAKIFCPQCGFENKPAARFCPQCGSSLPKRESMPVNFAPLEQSFTSNASKSDSTDLAHRELIRALIADPEFDRLLQQRIQSALREAPSKPAAAPIIKHKANPVGSFLAVVGGVTCSLLLLGLVVSL
jgi:predicted amidophosphoribosyltransferase